jgi:hypothetical protein
MDRRTIPSLAALFLTCLPLAAQPSYKDDIFHGRKAYVLENGVIRVSALRGGGHLGEIRFLSDNPKKSINPMYIPAYQTMEPYEYDPVRDRKKYGSALSAGYMGLMVCFPNFGPPSSPNEAKNGLGGHGEAATVEWKQQKPPHVDSNAVTLYYAAELPKTQYHVERTVTLPAGESVVYVEEVYENLTNYDRPYNRDGHATFGMPFVDLGKNFFDTSAKHGMIEVRPNHSLLSGREIQQWPQGFSPNGRRVDLRGIQDAPKTNTFYALATDQSRPLNYFTLYNTEYPVLIGYLLPSDENAWIIDWQNNQGDRFTRGIEFGTSPFDEGLKKSVERGTLLNVPTYQWINGRGKFTVHYAIFLAEIPSGFKGVENVEKTNGKILITERETGRQISVASSRD